MARIRTIKPEFFRHHKLFKAEKETGLPLRVAFAGLWTCSDREGRFKWEPPELGIQCIPYDEVDFSRVLDALATRGFVVKYESGGREYGHIPSFKDHQVINNREADSILPDPNDCKASDACGTRDPREDHADIGEGKGREGKGREGDIAPNGACPHEEIIALYHEVLPELRGVRVWNDRRQAMLRARWREDAKRQNLDWWRDFFGYVRKCDFLMGRVQGREGKPFQADLEWLVSPTNFAKVVEGKYE